MIIKPAEGNINKDMKLLLCKSGKENIKD